MAQTAAKAMIAAAALLVAAMPTPSYSQAAQGKGQTGAQGTSGNCNAPGQIKKGSSCGQASGGAAGGTQGSGGAQGQQGGNAQGQQGAAQSGSSSSKGSSTTGQQGATSQTSGGGQQGTTSSGGGQQGATSKTPGGGQQGAASQAGQGNGNADLSTEQRTRIREIVLNNRNGPRIARADFPVSVGTVVPSSVRFVRLPAPIVRIYPAWRDYDYVVVRDRILIIDPVDHRIVAVLES
jgi:hypothetical protein